MSDNLQLTFLKEKMSHEIRGFKRRVEWNRKWAVRLRILTVTAGAATTILIGLSKYVPHYPDYMAALALVVSAFVPAVAAIESLYEPRRMWIVYNGTLVALYGLSDELEFATLAQNLPPEGLKTFFDRLESILGNADASWQKQRLSSAERDAKTEADRAAEPAK